MIFIEKDDPRDSVTFTDREWATMMADPVYFGYSCPNGHALREDDPAVIANGCMVCFEEGEFESGIYDDCEGEPDAATLRALARRAARLRDFPVISCGSCKGQHVGTGAVKRCYANAGRFTR